MLIDNARGVEPQTRKLFAVCRQRGIPIFTFINKMDRPGQEPLDLLAEIEEVLGIRSAPVNWPIGNGADFRGVYDRLTRTVHLFERTEHGARRARWRRRTLPTRNWNGRWEHPVWRAFGTMSICWMSRASRWARSESMPGDNPGLLRQRGHEFRR